MQHAALEKATAQFASAENAASDAARTLERIEPLAQKGIAPVQQVQASRLAVAQTGLALSSARAQVRMAEADIAVAEGQVQQRRATLSIAETDLERTVIRSPVNGIVVNRQVDVGQTVAASLQAPILFEIAQDLREMSLEASVDEADIGKVRVGNTTAFTVDAHPNRSFEGRVKQVRMAPKVVQNVTTYTVIIEAANPKLELLPGMTANVRIIQARADNVVKVPAAALRFRPDNDPPPPPGPQREGARPSRERFVYLPSDSGAPKRVPVTIGVIGDREVEIVTGLEAGQAVIVGKTEGKPEGPGRSRSPLGV
jgi:HlyD family secretion protein